MQSRRAVRRRRYRARRVSTRIAILITVLLVGGLAVAAKEARLSLRPASAAIASVTSAPNTSVSVSQRPAALQEKSVVPTGKWVLSWDQEFNGFGPLANWAHMTGGNGFGDAELQWYSPGNASLDGRGNLVISGTKGGSGQVCWYGPCRYASAAIDTLGIFTQTYGRFEARIKLPGGAGIWPAFWLQGTTIATPGSYANGEIDIIEVNGKMPYLVKGYAHASNFKHWATLAISQPIYQQYHVFGVDWTPTGISWTFDGHVYSHMNAFPRWPFSHPFYIILDLAIGGNWPGAPTSNTKFPARLLVDWVHVYRWVK